MTEPVVYLVNGVAFNDIDRAKVYSDVLKYHKKIAVESLVPIPLYTAEQLHPRVKMTKKQHRQFENYKTNKNTFYHFWQSLLVDDVSLFKEISERNLILAWLDDRTIEIVPNMKWFVRSKTSDEKYGYWYLHKTEHYFFHEYIKELSTQFDTKEEAEEWTNPLTEAVQLPVEDD